MRSGSKTDHYQMKKIILNIFIILILTAPCFGQVDTVQLLEPTGKYPIGTVTYEWMDESREMQIRPDELEKRVIITQIWYPATQDTHFTIAPYSALSSDYRNTQTNSYLRPKFSQQVDICPLIIIIPGRGTERFLYTTIAEELASNGYIVASIDLPEIGFVLYQDGFILKPSDEFKPPRGMMAGPYERVDEFFEKPTAKGFQDVLFAINKLSQLNKNDLNFRLRNKINLDNIGVFGHSLGGRIAGELTARYENVKALAAMEGIPPRDVRYEGKIKVPSLMLCSSATFKYAVDNYNSYIDNRKSIIYMAELFDFGHNSLTDNPYIYPNSFNYKIDPAKGLEMGRRILTDFFNEYLKGEKGFFAKSREFEFMKIIRHKQ